MNWNQDHEPIMKSGRITNTSRRVLNLNILQFTTFFKSYLIIERCCHEIYNFRVKIRNFVSKFPWIILKIGEIRKWKLNWALMYNRENFEKLKFQGFSSYTTDVIQPLILLFILYLKCILIYVAIATKNLSVRRSLVLTDKSQCLIATPKPLLSLSRS